MNEREKQLYYIESKLLSFFRAAKLKLNIKQALILLTHDCNDSVRGKSLVVQTKIIIISISIILNIFIIVISLPQY